MGNQIGAKNQISVYVEQKIYQANDEVKGIVFLNIQEEIHAESLVIYLKCYEDFSLKTKQYIPPVQNNINQEINDNNNNSEEGFGQVSHDDYQQEYKDNYISNKNVFYSHRIALQTWNDKEILQKGNYQVPFSYKLFQNCQSSFYADIDHYAQLQYKVQAELIQYKNSGITIRSSQRFLVKSDFTDLPQKFSQSCSTMIKEWVFFNKGVSKMNCNLNKTIYKPFDNIEINCETDNSKCEQKLKYIQIKVIHQLKLRNKFNNYQTIDTNILEKKFWGIKDKQILKFPLVSNRTIYPSTQGDIVKSQYIVQIQGGYDGFTCMSNVPKIEFPIYIEPTFLNTDNKVYNAVNNATIKPKL